MKSKTLDRAIVMACLAGILLCTYALYVEMTIETQPGYKALCDISEHVSCSRVLGSEFSKGFGVTQQDSPFKIPNCIYGIAFFCLMIFLSTFDRLFVVRVQFLLCLSSLVGCVYLGYLLAFVLHDFCVVCVSSYVANIVLSILVYKKKNQLASKKSK